MRRWRWMGLAILWFAATACNPSSDTDAPANETPAIDPETVDGARLYNRKCASCHGATGLGDGPSGPIHQAANIASAEVQDRLSDEEIGDIIRNGRGRMTAIMGLHDVEVDAIVEYVRTLRAP